MAKICLFVYMAAHLSVFNTELFPIDFKGILQSYAGIYLINIQFIDAVYVLLNSYVRIHILLKTFYRLANGA